MAKKERLYLKFKAEVAQYFFRIFPTVIVNFLVYLLKTLVGETHIQGSAFGVEDVSLKMNRDSLSLIPITSLNL